MYTTRPRDYHHGMSDRGVLSTYELIGLIGRGGMAEVYLVRSRHGGELRALKVLHLPSAAVLARIEREGRLQARIEHENVLPVLEETTFLGRPALLLPYVEGPSLERLLAEGKLAPSQALGLLRGVIEGLDAIHSSGLVHRDLKPGNVLIDPSSGVGVPRISDFGLARDLRGEARLTRTGVGLGTPLYAAPEQMRDAARVDARADVFALGCLLVELLAGRGPEDEPISARSHRLVEPWRSLALALLAEDPADRPADAAAVRRLLPPITREEPLSAASCRSLAPVVLPVPSPEAPLVAGQTLAPATLERETRTDPLPAERDPFVGRRSEISTLRGVLDEGARLATIIGPGGVGKTRFALRFAREHQRRWPGGVWFVDLSEARELAGIVAAVAARFDVQLDPIDPARQIGHAVRSCGRCLLLLDNFEQVSAHAEATIGRWLEIAGDAQILVTSRSVLGIPGEHLLALQPLDPQDAELLFFKRAQAVSPGFSPDESTLASIRSLVSLLDGLPLAIELAAARVRSLSPRQILLRMEERFTVLTSSGARRGRQATLRATLDWSYQLLSPDEQQALCQLSVFEGGALMAAAEATLLLSGGTEPLEALQGLIDRSLVSVGRDRIYLLASVRQYAAEKLGAQTEAAEIRHGQYFARFSTWQVRNALIRKGGDRALLHEIDNLVVACRRAARRGDREVAPKVLAASWSVLQLRGHPALARELAQGVLGIATLDPLDRVRVLRLAGDVEQHAGDIAQTRRYLEDALERVNKVENPKETSDILVDLSRLAVIEDTPDAEPLLSSALSLAREHKQRRQEGVLLAHFALLHTRRGRLEEADKGYAAGLAIAEELSDELLETQILANVAVLRFTQGRREESQRLFEEALALAISVGDQRTEGTCRENLAVLLRGAAHFDRAVQLLQGALQLARTLGRRRSELNISLHLGELYTAFERFDEAHALLHSALALSRACKSPDREVGLLTALSDLHLRRGEAQQARALCASARALLESLGPDHLSPYKAQLASLVGRLGDLAGATAMLEGRLAELDSPVARESHTFPQELGVALIFRAEVAAAVGDWERARRCIEDAKSLKLPPGDVPFDLFARLDELTSEQRPPSGRRRL